jgi:hypothetical protein
LVVDGIVAVVVPEEIAFAAKAGTERLPVSKTLLLVFNVVVDT